MVASCQGKAAKGFLRPDNYFVDFDHRLEK